MMIRVYSYLSRMLTSLLLGVACASASEFRHIPPPPDGAAKMLLVVTVPQAERVRVLVATQDGYQTVPMEHDGDTFRAEISFSRHAVLRYQFQSQDTDGRFSESEYFTIRQPADPQIEKAIQQLSAKLDQASAKHQQLENAIHSLRSADPELLGRQKSAALAKALVTLGQRERELRDELAKKAMNEASTAKGAR